MKKKIITMTDEEFQKAKLDAYREGMTMALDRFNKQNNQYIAIGKAIENLIYEKAEMKHEDDY